MKEWDVVLIIVVLLNMILSVYNPLSKSQKENTKAMTKLTVTMESLTGRMLNHEKDMDVLEEKNHASHRRLWNHSEEQDKRLNEHENRIVKLEEKRNEK